MIRPGSPERRRILVAVDCSDHSDAATEWAIRLGRGTGTEITGLHAFAAKMHDFRFRQMESGLPEQYRKEEELERQRDVHNDLITQGLELISDSYLDQTARRCAEEGLPFERSSAEGRNYEVVLAAANGGDQDLLVLGSQGLGAVREGVIGTVCERVVRRTAIDTLVIKDLGRSLGDGPILVAIDGSPRSFGALQTALDIAIEHGLAVHAVAAFDPYYHYVAFKRIAEVLSEEAGKVFRFEEQEKLHEEIIDSGLAKIYTAHLRIATSIAEERGVDLTTTLLEGKPYDAILKHCDEIGPCLLVLGKTGVHGDDDLDIGGNTQHLLRLAPCNLWIGTRTHVPELDLIAQETITWTDEAEERMTRVPEFVRNMARMAILRYAQERGHTVITAAIVDEASALLHPGGGGAPGGRPSSAPVDITITPAGQALLERIKDPTVRSNVRLRAEKNARSQRVTEVDAEHVRPFLPEGIATPEQQAEPTEDATLSWSERAAERLARVPAGFMRKAARGRIEEVARQGGHTHITLAIAEEGLAAARQMMSRMVSQEGVPQDGESAAPGARGPAGAASPEQD